MYEKEIEKKVCDYAREKGFLVYKFSSPACVGVPDRMFLKNGFTFFIEFKSPGKKPTSVQLRQHRKLQDQGFIVSIVDNVKEGCELIDKLCEK